VSSVEHKVVADPPVPAREVSSFERLGVDLAHGLPSLAGRTALVTGANSGIGLATAKALAGAGARVLMACRSSTKAEAAAAEVRSGVVGTVEVLSLDLSRLDTVKACAEQVLAGESRLDFLINNAAVAGLDRTATSDGFEMQIGVNHLGHFALDAQLMPLVLATPASRVLTMSSAGYRPGHVITDDLHFERRPYNRWFAYAQSKLANLLYSLELQRRLAEAGHRTIALSVHPGGARTELGTEGSSWANRLVAPIMLLLQAPERAAWPMLRAATDPRARGGDTTAPGTSYAAGPCRCDPAEGPATPRTPDGCGRHQNSSLALCSRSPPQRVH
jgi:NAD(P)-dependent dehydrogenase (short-subunit alcohol dehydrogenase family)